MNDDPDPKIEKRKHWQKVAKKTGKCALCPPHAGENLRPTPKRKSKPRKQR